jgi:hypothetical protein
MNEDLKSVELEIARIKLAREKLALEKELKSRLRTEQVSYASERAAENARGALVRTRRALNWMVYWPLAFGIFVFMIGGPGDMSLAWLLVLAAGAILIFRAVKR